VRREALVGAVVALAVGAGSAQAAVRYAAPNGDGPAAKCQRANPCDLQDAVEHSTVGDGDAVVVLPGTYSLEDTVRVEDAIEVHGQIQRRPPHLIGEFNGGSTIEVLGTAGDAEVHHLRLTKEAGGAISAGSGHVHDISARSGDLSEATLYGQDPFGASNGVVIERVVARGPAPAACIPPLAPGILRDSVCHASGTDGFGVEIYPSQGGDYDIRNVTALGPGGGIIARAQSTEVVNLEARNVITDGIGIDVEAREIGVPAEVQIQLSSSNYAQENEVNGATVTDPGTGANQTDDYRLADPAGGNYVQLPGSPTRDAGTGGMLGRFDFQRQLRNQGEAPDIGADEFDTGLRLRAKARTRQGGRVAMVKIKCPLEDCAVTARGKGVRPKRAERHLLAGKPSTLKLKARRGEERAKLKLRAEDGGGSVARKRLTVDLAG
jgi:hypothetical protein